MVASGSRDRRCDGAALWCLEAGESDGTAHSAVASGGRGLCDMADVVGIGQCMGQWIMDQRQT